MWSETGQRTEVLHRLNWAIRPGAEAEIGHGTRLLEGVFARRTFPEAMTEGRGPPALVDASSR